MNIDELRRQFSPAILEIIDQCRVSDDFVDKEMFRVYIATIWGNAVLEPARTGLEESELSVLHDYLNEEIEKIMGPGEDITSCYEFIVSKEGDESLARLQVSARHKEFLHYFARLILAAAG
jgi:hypothetical protein